MRRLDFHLELGVGGCVAVLPVDLYDQTRESLVSLWRDVWVAARDLNNSAIIVEASC